MLPSSHTSALSSCTPGPRMHEYFRRMVNFRQMDFDLVLAQMMSLCLSPERAFKEAKNRKLTKNHWARDDPAFLMLLIGQVIAVCISYFIAICLPLGLPVSTLFKLILYELVFNFLIVGLMLCTVFWLVANRYLHGKGQMHEVRQPIEWQYSFDIHCNAFFTMLMICGVLQLLFLPWLLQPTFIARALSNALHSFAFAMYFYITFRGYLELPFLECQEYFLYPVFLIVLCFALSLVTPFNSTSYVINSWTTS